MGKSVIQTDEGFAVGKGKGNMGTQKQFTTPMYVIYEVKGYFYN